MSYNDDYYNQPYDDRWNIRPKGSDSVIGLILIIVILLIAML